MRRTTQVQWESTCDYIVSRFIELKAKVSNLSSCRTYTAQSISSPSFQLNSNQTSTVQNTMNFSVAAAVFELTSDIPDSSFHNDFEDCYICLKSRYFNMITVQLQVPIALHCVTSLHKSIEHFARHLHSRRCLSVRRKTQVQWE